MLPWLCPEGQTEPQSSNHRKGNTSPFKTFPPYSPWLPLVEHWGLMGKLLLIKMSMVTLLRMSPSCPPTPPVPLGYHVISLICANFRTGSCNIFLEQISTITVLHCGICCFFF